MSIQVGFLAHYQAVDCKPSTTVSKAVAELLVLRLAAERISRKLIRAFPPGTVFSRLETSKARYIPENMPSGEIANCRFQLPQSDGWKREHLQARRFNDEMAYLMRRSLRKAVSA